MKLSWIKKEWAFIIIAWLLIYASDPLYMLYAEMAGQFEFSWAKQIPQWTYTTAFLILFLVHHFALMPTLIVKKKRTLYISCVVVCILAFTAFLILQTPEEFNRHHFQREGEAIEVKHLLLAPPDLARLVMALLMIVADLGAMAWVNEQKLRHQLLQLEKQTLNHELAQLRYQINPHFFMNTLNNIHALVDIDQERAKRAIVELSGMMRYSLYEGSETLSPLQHELDFVRKFISLMKLRFGNKIVLSCEFPESTPSYVMIPPLLLTTFVENAFKHGISYQNPSFISIHLEVKGDKIHFQCTNSRYLNGKKRDDHHGIGLTNVRKRLDLLFKDRYQLLIDESEPTVFTVNLTIPHL